MTELIWDGKYDDKGRKAVPPRIALPFQTVETVNESAADRDRMQDLFATGRPTDWRNRLIWGDKKYVLPSLLQEFGGKVNVIYIDPPFATGGDFSFTAVVPDDPDGDDDETGVSFDGRAQVSHHRYGGRERGTPNHRAWRLTDAEADKGSIELFAAPPQTFI